VVEFGTSFGISTIHFAAAVRDVGGGRVITAEQIAGKVRHPDHGYASVEVPIGDRLELSVRRF